MNHHHHHHYYRRHAYFLGTLFDFFMVLVTGGLWLLWMLVRFLRRNTR